MRACGERAGGRAETKPLGARPAWTLTLLLLMLAGCRREAPPVAAAAPAATSTEASRTTAGEPAPSVAESDATAGPVVLVVGTRQGSSGAAMVAKSGFSIGEPVVFVLRGGPGAPGEVELVWRDANDAELHRARSPLAPGRSVEPSFTPPGGWAAGSYRLEALAGGQVVAELRFEVAELGAGSERPGA